MINFMDLLVPFFILMAGSISGAIWGWFMGPLYISLAVLLWIGFYTVFADQVEWTIAKIGDGVKWIKDYPRWSKNRDNPT